jgi:hypothetical protein
MNLVRILKQLMPPRMSTSKKYSQLKTIKLMRVLKSLSEQCKLSKNLLMYKNKKFMPACFMDFLMNTDSCIDIHLNTLQK